MRRIDSIEDRMNGVVTYALDDGRSLRLSRRAVEMYGPGEMLRRYGGVVNTARLSVYQHGRKIGSVGWDFDPEFLRSRSMLYAVREGDWTRTERGWEASPSLGPGDLLAAGIRAEK